MSEFSKDVEASIEIGFYCARCNSANCGKVDISSSWRRKEDYEAKINACDCYIDEIDKLKEEIKELKEYIEELEKANEQES